MTARMTDRFPNAEILIEAENLSVTRRGKEILSDAGVRVRAGEIVPLIRPTGAGKAAVVRIGRGRVKADRGVVGYMPQRLHIDPTLPLTVGRFLALGAARGLTRGRPRTPDRTNRVLEEVGAGTIMDTPLQAVSGGEFQRILLARALLRDPDLLVLDEPSQGIDVTGQADLFALITRIRDQRGCGVLMVSHDLHLVMAQTDEVICLNHHVCCAGHPETGANDPSYIELFSKQVADSLAVYHHHHDHAHDADGRVVPLDGPPGDSPGDFPGEDDERASHG